ncbi:DNA breaking-rejoining protein [uncultured Stenotrophomonas sp.]|uniref:DNA breaking-rejoining protein n=1 Tax=uncultured Stenotrophomonas sp. TaxID=165438 RepID=UPI0025F1F0D5|nr:DNA breaking-rejoining protein [uncultured Stenotrophomonas sp.]
MKTILLMSILASAAITTPSQAQDATDPVKLLTTLDANALSTETSGRSFEIHGTRFRLATPTAVEDRADFGQPASSSTRVKRSAVDAPPVAGAGKDKLSAAISDDGAPVVVTSRVKLFFTDGAPVEAAARATGGRLVSISRAARRAIVEYASVNAALDAPERLLSQAGIRAAEPELIQGKEELL